MPKPQGYIQQLADHIRKNLGRGYTLESLKFSLLNQGYSRTSVENAIELANKQLAFSIPPIKEKPQITYKILTDDSEIKMSGRKGFFRWLFGR